MSGPNKIYYLSDPRNNNIRYVGATGDSLVNRLYKHMNDSHNREKLNWIIELKNIGLKPKISLLESANDDNWKEKEKYWIKYFTEIGADLFNISPGGCEISEITKERIGNFGRGKKFEKSRKLAIGNALRGKPKTESHKKKLSEAKSIMSLEQRNCIRRDRENGAKLMDLVEKYNISLSTASRICNSDD